jgi:hypothetical protein
MSKPRSSSGFQFAGPDRPTMSHDVGQGTGFDLADALRAAVNDLGGLQRVGHMLRPDHDPVLAGQWLSHCLNNDHRDKLSLRQITLILRTAHARAEHAGFHRLCAVHGYAPATPITPNDELADAVRAAQSARIASEQANARLIATMRAAGVNTEGM